MAQTLETGIFEKDDTVWKYHLTYFRMATEENKFKYKLSWLSKKF